MKKQSSLFLIFCLALTIGLLQAYSSFRDYFSPVREQARQISALKSDVEREKLKTTWAAQQLVDYQQEVAEALPEFQKIPKNPDTLAIRGIASVSQTPMSNIDFSRGILEQAKQSFRNKEYSQSAKDFKAMIEKYPTSPLVIESYFFLAEGYYLSGKHQECLDVIEHMLSFYPDHDFTGYILLRQGQILEGRHRSEEAAEVFATVKKKFSYNQELALQAGRLLAMVQK